MTKGSNLWFIALIVLLAVIGLVAAVNIYQAGREAKANYCDARFWQCRDLCGNFHQGFSTSKDTSYIDCVGKCYDIFIVNYDCAPKVRR